MVMPQPLGNMASPALSWLPRTREGKRSENAQIALQVFPNKYFAERAARFRKIPMTAQKRALCEA
eukprot:SAG31_NODE_27733_length_421_cov_0.732919_1_plen_64_part_01